MKLSDADYLRLRQAIALEENTTSGHAVMINEPDWLTEVLLKSS